MVEDVKERSVFGSFGLEFVKCNQRILGVNLKILIIILVCFIFVFFIKQNLKL